MEVDSDPWLLEPVTPQHTLLNPVKVVFRPVKEGESDQLLYDPTEDERNAAQFKDKSLQLSCGNCFTAVAFTNPTKHKEGPFKYDYAVAQADIRHVKLDEQQVFQQQPTTNEQDERFQMLFFNTCCERCGTNIGVFDHERSLYFLVNVVPRHLGE